MKVFCVVLTLFSATAWAQGSLWPEIRDELGDVVELYDEQAELPKSRLWGRDRKSAQRDIEALLDKLLLALEQSELTEAREDIHKIDSRVQAIREQKQELREQRISAPDEKQPYEFLVRTREDYTKKIQILEQDLRELELEKEKTLREMAEVYEGMGLEVSDEQLRFFLGSVGGEDIFRLSSLFHNIRDLNEQSATLMKEQPGDSKLARRYYGLYVVLVESALRAHDQVLNNIDERYLPRLSELEQRNEELMIETEELLAEARSEDVEILQASARVQELSAQSLILYRQHLQEFQQRVDQGRGKLEQRYKVARNAYDTLRVSSALADEVNSLLEELQNLRELHLPELLPLDDDAVQERFQDITRELQGN